MILPRVPGSSRHNARLPFMAKEAPLGWCFMIFFTIAANMKCLIFDHSCHGRCRLCLPGTVAAGVAAILRSGVPANGCS